jgi:histidyl-tRNA synthetase
MSEGAAKGFGEKPQPKKGEKPRKFQAIRGVRDILPPETALWTRVEQTAHEVFSTYNFGEIRLPIFEDRRLFERSVGMETDIVTKELFTILNVPSPQDIRARLTSEKEIDSPHSHVDEEEVIDSPVFALRPEATASVCRAYIEHNMQQLPQPVKLYYMGPMFRRERPQKGRYRQFYQIGAEVLETVRKDAASGESRVASTGKELRKDAAIDAEVIEMLVTFFEKCGLAGTTLYINSIGHNAPNCRRGYVEKLREALTKIKEKLGADSQRRIDTNPLRVLDSKLESEQPYIEKLPQIADHLCDECKTQYAALKRELDIRNVNYQENWRLVRGLDYYMRTTFEITAAGLGSQNAVCGGGRYDGLVELLGGPPTKGIGFAIGEDRLILAFHESAKSKVASGELRVASAHRLDVYVAWMGEKAYTSAIRATKNLRDAGFRIELTPVEQKFGKALGQADKLGAQYALILGEDEVNSGQWTLKNLASGEQRKLTEADLLQFLRQQKSV